MNNTIPDSDTAALEHRAKLEREYREAIENGTDHYTSKWFGYALIGLSAAFLILCAVDIYTWTPYR